ncbi:unnamed protein product [Pleuronectes platessa]|uniref:Uncharacterized protein n=1 Tax=Pleuronectes platessa TaxID=8262 RepID=A0A9N7UHU1_PLEPL|nr:unnamed protein product [Pleuronectes platessa]
MGLSPPRRRSRCSPCSCSETGCEYPASEKSDQTDSQGSVSQCHRGCQSMLVPSCPTMHRARPTLLLPLLLVLGLLLHLADAQNGTILRASPARYPIQWTLWLPLSGKVPIRPQNKPRFLLIRQLGCDHTCSDPHKGNLVAGPLKPGSSGSERSIMAAVLHLPSAYTWQDSGRRWHACRLKRYVSEPCGGAGVS